MATSRKAKPARTSQKKPTTAGRPKVKVTPSAAQGSRADAKSAPTRATKHSPSKQETVLGMLRNSKGTTITAIMKATSWQQHSVRGFLAGVVKKKLKLKLKSEMIGEARVYSLARAGAGS